MTTTDTAARWIGRGEALARLGVKTQTLYAYVSRGRIVARPDPADTRRSLYDAHDIDRLTGADTSPRPATAPVHILAARGEAELTSSQSVILDGRLFYRGLDAVQLSQQATLEEAARLLWDVRDPHPFGLLKPRVDGVGGATIRARILAALARRSDEDGSSLDRAPEALKAQAASVLNEIIDAAAGSGPRLHFHQRLARGWKVLDRDSHLIRRALVLAADHPLNASVLSTRAAAEGGASLAGAALAGIMTLAGSETARDLNDAAAWVIEARRDPAGAARRRLDQGQAIPGVCDLDWPQGDPRALSLLDAADLPPDLAGVVRESVAAGGAPGFALALAAVGRRLDLPRGGATDLLLLGRLTGLLGHALDQATNGSPIRARLRYVGPEPGAN